ncbi:hypothetical protein QC762_0026220 [Podospora pseudocomata]|uniref:Uncharacterized protein n=1 Tax=Podospora pseudocomata TaxID=2093779 RepID=A0ABR0GRS2_9PEZI|nr:hypothetical protein QC762_0026220 [Podospora pseudocomata]
MPPTTLATPTTIYIDPYTTEVEVGQMQNGTFSAITTTLTVAVASIVTSVIPVANYNYTGEESEGAPLWIISNIDIPPAPVVLTKPDGAITFSGEKANSFTPVPSVHTVTFTSS